METYYEYVTKVFNIFGFRMKDAYSHFYYNAQIPSAESLFEEPFQMLKDLDVDPSKCISDRITIEEQMEEDYNAPSFDLWEMTTEITEIFSEAQYHPDLEYNLENGIGYDAPLSPEEASRAAQEAYDHDIALLVEVEKLIEDTRDNVIRFCVLNERSKV